MPTLPPVPNTPLRDDPTQDSIWKRWLQLLKVSYASLGTVTSVAVSGGTTGLTTSGGPITTSGTITITGVLVGANGGTGVANTGKTITLGGNLTTTPANAITFTTTGATNVTLPTSGTLGTGTVTSVASNFTGGLISVAGSPIATSGTLAFTVAGTSGGIPYFSGATTWASSGALAANALLIGGGAGAAPASTTTGTGVLTALGINVGTAGSFITNGGALGSPSSAGTIPAFTLGGTISGGGNQLNNIIIGTSTPLAGSFTTLTTSGINTFGIKMSAAYVYTSWNPSDVAGTFTNGANSSSATYSDASYYTFSNSSGTLTINFVKAGSYIVTVTGAMGGNAAYTLNEMKLTQGGTATRYSGAGTGFASGGVGNPNYAGNRGIAIVATAGQTLTLLPAGRVVSAGATTDFTFYCDINVSYQGG